MFERLKAVGIVAFMLLLFVIVGTSEFNALERERPPQYEGCNC